MAETDRQARNHHIHRNARLGPRRSVAMTFGITRCPYKGVARHWSARVGDKLVKDTVWSYPAPIPECPKIENLLSFYNEHVDLYVEGVLQDRPVTPFS